MNKIDWIQLWLLNELAFVGSRLSHLIDHPNNDSPGYWAFPAREALRANADARIAALCTSMEQGLIEVFTHSWLNDPRFAAGNPYPAKEFDFRDPEFLEQAEAVLTVQGHEKWEADFQPDWARFWSVESESYDESNCESILSVLYASNDILDELLRWFPAYWGLDREVGLTELECHTTFQYQATSWKIIPCTKVITWKGQSSVVKLNKVLRDSILAGRPLKLKYDEQVRSEEHDQAYRILSRLSKQWVCVYESNGNRRDAGPEKGTF